MNYCHRYSSPCRQLWNSSRMVHLPGQASFLGWVYWNRKQSTRPSVKWRKSSQIPIKWVNLIKQYILYEVFKQPIFQVGICVWPVVQTINFTLIAEHNRVPFVSICSLLWTTFLAYMKQRSATSVSVAAPASTTSTAALQPSSMSSIQQQEAITQKQPAMVAL